MNAKQQLNSGLQIVAKKISDLSCKLALNHGRKTISETEIIQVINIVSINPFKKYCTEACEQAITEFNENTELKTGQGQTKQNKANLIFPVALCSRFLRNMGFNTLSITKNSSIYLACILEFICKNILAPAVKLSQENNRVRITIRDLELSLRKNISLSHLFDTFGICFLGGGVLPYINTALFTRKRRVYPGGGNPKPVKRKYRLGTISLREIKKYQNTSNNLTIAKVPFERLVRSITASLKPDMKISKDVFTILQYYTEQYIVNFLKESYKAAIHCQRIKLTVADINFINDMKKYPKIET